MGLLHIFKNRRQSWLISQFYRVWAFPSEMPLAWWPLGWFVEPILTCREISSLCREISSLNKNIDCFPYHIPDGSHNSKWKMNTWKMPTFVAQHMPYLRPVSPRELEKVLGGWPELVSSCSFSMLFKNFFLNFNSFIEVQLTYNQSHIFKMINLITFDIYRYI